MDEDKKIEKEAANEPGQDVSGPVAEPKKPEPPAPGTARILARAGEAFDAVEAGRAIHERGLRDPARLEPTDQTFVFAEPGQKKSTYVADDNVLHSAEPVFPGGPGAVAGGTSSAPAVDLTEAPDPDISWRARPLSSGSGPVPTGVLQEAARPEELPDEAAGDLFATAAGLFGDDDAPGPEDEGAAPGHELVLGVKFREYGSVYFFRAGRERIRAGAKVLVESEYGLSLAEVISARNMRLPLPKIRTADGDEVEIKPILGLPKPEDIAAAADNKILAAGARLFCKECIRERNLDMKLVDVEVLHDRSKIIFYFTAPTRIDFRELVKDLVRNYRTRIELRQIGVRHETQMLGALGNCGMACCCRRYLRRFAPVTIKMAKEQNLFLNPAKLSGICGRLLCCLANEQENYEEFHRNCPKVGKKYQTAHGVMKVLRANLFRQSIVALDEAGAEEEFLLDSWHALNPQRLEAREQREGGPVRPDPRAADAEAAGGPDLSGYSDEAALAGLEDDESAPRPSPGPERPEKREHAGRGDGERRPGRGQRGDRDRRPDNRSNNRPGPKDGSKGASDKSIFGLPGSGYKK